MPVLLPLLTNGLIITFPTLSNLVQHAASALLAIFTLLGVIAWLTRKHHPRFTRTDNIIMASFAGYFIVCLLIFLVQQFLDPSGGYRLNLDHIIRMMALIPLYFLFLRSGVTSGSFWFGVATGAIAAGIYAFLFVYALHAGQADIRAVGSVHPIAFGDISLMLGFISLAGLRYFEEKHPLLIVVPVIALASGILAAFLSGTRGALIAIPLLTVFFLVQLGRHPRHRTYRSIILVTVAVLSLAGYYLPGSSTSARIHTGIKDTVQFFKGEATHPLQDSQLRLEMWTQAWQMIRQHPFIGVGRDGFKRIILEKTKTDPRLEALHNFQSPHNMYLTIWAAYGIGGLIVLLAVFLSPLLIFIPAMRRDGPVRDFAYAGIMEIAAFMQFSLTESIFYRNINITVYIVLTAALLALIQLYQNQTYGDDR